MISVYITVCALWPAVPYSGASPLVYAWSFGPGEGSASGTVSDSANIAVLTETSIPSGVTTLDAGVPWSGDIDPAETQLRDDELMPGCPRVAGSCSDLSGITWDIELTDALGTRHVIRRVLQ